jgi:hypothetical protein
MAFRHQLSLEFPDYSNPEILAVTDTSQYAPELSVNCPLIQVVPPGFAQSIDIPVAPGFMQLINACDLLLQNDDCGYTRWPLPDGVYIIKYSISPNNKVWIEYTIMRVAGILQKYYQAEANLDLNACDPSEGIKERLKELRLIKSFIDASKSMVEHADQPQKGMDLYMYAQNRLARLRKAHQY